MKRQKLVSTKLGKLQFQKRIGLQIHDVNGHTTQYHAKPQEWRCCRASGCPRQNITIIHYTQELQDVRHVIQTCNLRKLRSKLYGVRSRLYRSKQESNCVRSFSERFSPPNTRWKHIDETYRFYIHLHLSHRKISASVHLFYCCKIFPRKVTHVTHNCFPFFR